MVILQPILSQNTLQMVKLCFFIWSTWLKGRLCQLPIKLINMSDKIVNCGKYDAKTHSCCRPNFRQVQKKLSSWADRRNDRKPQCSPATRLFCQKTCTAKGHKCCSVSLVLQKLVALDPISVFWPHFDKILATRSTITSVFLDNSIAIKVTKNNNKNKPQYGQWKCPGLDKKLIFPLFTFFAVPFRETTSLLLTDNTHEVFYSVLF